MKKRFLDFMAGRYGADELTKFMTTVCLVCLVLNIFTHWQILYVLALVILFVSYFRMFSRNYSRRNAENQKYLQAVWKLKNKTGKMKYKLEEKNIIVSEVDCLDIELCLFCGQAFRWKKNEETIEHYKEFGLYPSDNVLSVPAHLENFRFSFWPEDAGKGIAISAGAEHSSTEGFDFICGISYRIPIWKGLSAGIGAQIRCIRQVMDDSGSASADLNLNYRF